MKRYQIKAHDFSATVMFHESDAWTCGSCDVPPLGSLAAMGRYQRFITSVINCIASLNCRAQGFSLTDTEIAYLKNYIKGYEHV